VDTESADTAHGVASELFEANADVFGDDLAPYRGHVHRVIGLVALQVDVTESLAEPLGIAAFYHDAAIWFDRTWDYLPKSIERALGKLGAPLEEHAELVTAMIDEHHRLKKAHHSHPIVEAFRKADRYDIYWGLTPAPGVARSDFRELLDNYPNAGFRRMLARAFAKGLRENPRRPMPMLKF